MDLDEDMFYDDDVDGLGKRYWIVNVTKVSIFYVMLISFKSNVSQIPNIKYINLFF